MSALEELLSDLKEVCAGLEDKRRGEGYHYTMADIGLAAFSVFFMQSPSFLGHQRALAEGHGRSNCQTLLGMAATFARKSRSDFGLRCASRPDAPLVHRPPSRATTTSARCSTATRPAPSTGCSSRGWRALPRPFGIPAPGLLIALDGTEHFCSRKIGCPQCS